MQSVTADESQNDDFTMGSAGPNIPRQTPANIGPGAPTPPPPNPGNGLTALAVNYGEAASDPEDTTQRAAVRSSIAEALHTWGCREDPNGWDWTHLGDALESTLRTSSCKQLGDTWMLATTLLEQEHTARWEEMKDSVSGWVRDFGGEQRSMWG